MLSFRAALLSSVYSADGGASLPGAHRYWRINITAVGSGQLAAINGLELYETEFGENLATNSANASADSTFSGSDFPSNAFEMWNYDGAGNNNAWASADTALPHWLAYDFGAGNEKEILSVGITARDASKYSQQPTAFDVQYSDDGSTWTTAWSETTTWIGGNAYAFKRFTHPDAALTYTGSPHGAHTYWRIAIIDVETPGSAAALGEVEMRATVSGADQCSGGTAAADASFNGSLLPANAFDNNTGTLWSSTDKGAYNFAWLRYQFASPVEVAEFAIRARSDGFAYTSPEVMQFQYSDDGTNWTTAWAMEAQTGWSAGEQRLSADPSYV